VTVGPVLLAVLVGLLAGAGAIALRQMITAVRWVFFVQLPRLNGLLALPDVLEGWPVLVAPAIGLVLVVWIVRRWSPESAGHGVPEVQYALRALGGRIRPRVVLTKAVTASLSIGSGGSVGREGPIVQIGSALGSAVGQLTGLGTAQVKLLVACGAAGAVGATFNAPIAGVMFALEVVLESFAARSFGLVVIAAVSATALSQATLGNEPAFQLLQQFTLVSPMEFGLYLLLGGLLGLVSALYIRSVYWFEDSFGAWGASQTTKALVGGLAVGTMGLYGSELILGSGHEGVELALQGDLAIWLMVGLAVMKIVATSVTLGAGGSGGVFAPALFIGAMAGGAFGSVVHALFPTWTAPQGAYALVGMAAVFGGAAHAPITGVLILFEMTGNYQIMLPLMFSVVVSYLVASRVSSDSIYSLKLRRRGAFGLKSEMSTLDLVIVADAMSEVYETVGPDMTVRELTEMARGRRTRSWPVVDEADALLGIVTETDLERYILEPGHESEDESVRVSDVMTRAVTTCSLDESLRVAFGRFADGDVQLIPVVGQDGSGTLIGVLRRREMLWAYRELAGEHQKLLDKLQVRVRDPREETVQIEAQVAEGNRDITGRPLRNLALPEHLLIALVRRADETFVPSGATRLEEGDVLVLLGTARYRGEIEELARRVERGAG
jgi:CIC family chloride channel protein